MQIKIIVTDSDGDEWEVVGPLTDTHGKVNDDLKDDEFILSATNYLESIKVAMYGQD